MAVTDFLIRNILGISEKRGNNKNADVQLSQLKLLLKKAEATEFGKYFDFQSILQSDNIYEKFKQNVPVNNYNSLQPWWEKARHGEGDICWPGKTKYFALSSGTTSDSSKYIPITKDIITSIQRAGKAQLAVVISAGLHKNIFSRTLIVGGTSKLRFNAHSYEAYLSGILTSQMPALVQNLYKPGRLISALPWDKKVDQVIKNAQYWDIACVCGVTSWSELLFEKIIDHYKLDTIHDIWPNLEYFVHGGVSLEPYLSSLAHIFGRPVKYFETYLASEGFFALQMHPDAKGMQLFLDNGVFYEFIPFDDASFDLSGQLLPGHKTISLYDVVPGQDYALVVSTCAGNWRYLLGDVIRFCSVDNYEVKIVGRVSFFLNVCGEHLSGEQTDVAIRALCEEFHIDANEYCIAYKQGENKFVHRWFISCDDKLNEDAVRTFLDRLLQKMNKNYLNERSIGTLDISVQLVPSHFFLDWMRHKGKMGEQHKFPRLLDSVRLMEWESFIGETK